MAKVALITDTHFGVKNDSPEFIDYQTEFYLNEFFPKLLETGVDKIIHLGDIFDRRKYTNHQTLQAFKTAFFDKLVENDIHMTLILGNHDVYYKSTNSVNSPELFLSSYSDNITIIDEPSILKFGKTKIAFLPWINLENYEESIEFMKNCDSNTLFGHFEISGFEMHRNGGLCTTGLKASTFDNFDQVFSGHFHEPSSDGRITYLGAPHEYTWADYGCDRGFYIYDTNSGDYDYIKSKSNMFYRITYDEFLDTSKYDVSKLSNKIVRLIVADKMGDVDAFENFVESIQRANPFSFEVIDNIDYHVDEDSIDEEALRSEDTMAIVKSYVDESDIALDKDRINTMFKSLYAEAIAQE